MDAFQQKPAMYVIQVTRHVLREDTPNSNSFDDGRRCRILVLVCDGCLKARGRGESGPDKGSSPPPTLPFSTHSGNHDLGGMRATKKKGQGKETSSLPASHVEDVRLGIDATAEGAPLSCPSGSGEHRGRVAVEEARRLQTAPEASSHNLPWGLMCVACERRTSSPYHSARTAK